MEKADITVLVPIYNVEKYIAKCLKSLENQTYKNFEVWAVNDGSPDNSKEIVKKFSMKDNRIKLINKRNGGYGSVLQLGVDKIQTKYMLVCDPDDWLAPNALEVLHYYAEKYDTDIVVGDRYNVYIQDGKKKYINTFDRKLRLKSNTVYKTPQEIQKFSFGLVSPHAKLYKTSVIRNIKFPVKVSYTDFVLYMLALSKSKKVIYCKEALAYYLTNRPGNSRTNTNSSIVREYYLGWRAVFDQISNIKQKPIFLYRLYDQLRYIISEYLRVSRRPFKDENEKYIYLMATRLQKYKKSIKPFIGKFKFKLYFMGIMNKKFYKQDLYLYAKMKALNKR